MKDSPSQFKFFFGDLMKIETEEEKIWYASRPTLVKRVIDEFPDGPCYHIKRTKGHYRLYAFAEDLRTGACTVKMIHLEDSWGHENQTDQDTIFVFGLPPEQVIQCGCRSNPPS